MIKGKKLIDLHVHLDGSLSFFMARHLAAMQHMDQKTDAALKDLLVVPEDCPDLNAYLTKFQYPSQLLQREEALTWSVCELLRLQESQGLVYSEIRFAPQLHTKLGLSQRQVVAAAVRGLEAFQKLSSGQGMDAGLILCCMRGNDNKRENMETVAAAAEYLGKGVVALDLAGAEGLFPTEQFEDVFKIASKNNIPFTIHAGEADGPRSIWKALEFGAERIGHGVRCIEDPVLVRRLAADKIPLELCPTSNMNTKIFKNITDYPLMYFLEEGIKATINTDNMTVSCVTVESELELMEKTFDLKDDEIETLLQNSRDAAFDRQGE